MSTINIHISYDSTGKKEGEMIQHISLYTSVMENPIVFIVKAYLIKPPI